MATPTIIDPAARTVEPEVDGSQGARESRALAEIVHEINRSPELHRVFALIARHAAELLGGVGSCVGMLDGGEITIVGTFGDVHGSVGSRLPADDALCAEAIRTSRPVRLLLEGAAARGTAGTEALNAVVAPLLVGQRAIGAIGVFAGAAREFGVHDEQILFALANHAAVAIENARLLRASVRTLRHASILANSARSLALNVSPQAMYADIWRVAHQSLGADGITIYLADPTTRAAEQAFVSGAGADLVEQVVPNFWDTLLGRTVTAALPDFRGDLRALEERPIVRQLLERGLKAIAMLPLVVEGRPRGVLALRFRATQTFEPEQRQLLSDFSAHAAVALRNALLLERTERRASRFSAIAKVQQAISSSLSLADTYAEIYRAVASVVDAPHFALMRFDDEHQEFFADYIVEDGRAVGPSTLERFPLADGATSQAYKLRAPSVSCRTAQGWSGPPGELETNDRSAVLLTAPIVNGDCVLGVLQARSYRMDAYDWSDVDLVMLIARQAGTAIDNALLFQAERHQRLEAEAAAEIARLALGDTGIDDAAAELLRVLHDVAASKAWALAVQRPGESEFHIVGTLGATEALAGTPTLAREVENIPGTWDALLPLFARGQPVGLLAVGTAVSRSCRRLATVHRLLPSIALALHTIRLREEERHIAEQMRQSEKLAAVGELVAGVAHEVNNPLAGISAFAQLLQEDDLTVDQREAVEMIKREADRAVTVIRDLLTFARKSGPRSVVVDVNALLHQTLRLRQYGLRTSAIRTVLELDQKLQTLHGDDRQLQQVFLNLIVNAEHAMATTEPRILRVRTLNAAGRVVIEIGDNGVGMTPEVQARIFEPFFTTKGEGKGTGLGLSVSYGIVQTHGGTLVVESALGAGSTFRVSLPADRRAAAANPATA